MMENGRKFLFIMYLVLVLFCASWVRAADQIPSLLPAGIVMQDVFKPGFGVNVGQVQRTTDWVALIHAQDTVGYWARIKLPVFMRDAVITPTDGRAILLFQDESTVAISADTKLVINRSIYDPDKKERSSFIDITMGKARFWVKKLPGFARSEFKIKTKTLVAGVRGSDLVVDDNHPNYTNLYAFEDTEIEFTGFADPTKTFILNSLEKITAFEGKPISEEDIVQLSPEEAEQLKNEMQLPQSQGEKGTTAPVKKGATQEAKGATDQGSASEAAPPILNVQQEAILLSGDELADPVSPIDILAEPTLVPEIIEDMEYTDMAQEAMNQQQDIQQDVAEDIINETFGISELPSFPVTP